MKQLKIVLAAALMLTGLTSLNAEERPDYFKLLVNKTWEILDYKMTGKGEPSVLHTKAHLIIHNDGSWESTEELEGATDGSWGIDQPNKTFHLKNSRGKMVIDAKFSRLDNELLIFDYRTKSANYTMTWKRVN